MMADRLTYKRLGDYICEVDVRNRDLAVSNLLGVSVSKEFISSIANTIGTDMSTYKLVYKGQFVYIADTSRRGDKIAIALLGNYEKAIVSAIYTVFEIVNVAELLPEYLMMWFRRPEFDRYARFHSHGSAREIFDWSEMCDVVMPIPSIEQQHKIVAEYETLSRRIALNQQLITRLEEAAQALYRKMFVNDIDKEHLEEGWRMGTLGEIASISSGYTCMDKLSKSNAEYIYPVTGASGIIGYSPNYNQNGKLLTIGRVGTLGVVKRYKEKIYAADNVLIVRSVYYEYCYQILKSLDYFEMTKGGVQSLITQTDLSAAEILIPCNTSIIFFEVQSSIIFNHIDRIINENLKLTKIQSLLLAKMGTI